MKISIITICYNNAKDIRKTIESVISQTYSNIEYIVIDGASTDGTTQIVYEYSEHISLIISEPDNGIYDALNKGIKKSTGDVVGFIHAGDMLCNNDIITKIALLFEENDVDISYGNSYNVNYKGIVVRKNPGLKHPYKWAIKLGWMPSHMSIYTKRSLFDKYGYYRLDIGYAADYEWFLRYFYKHGDELRFKLLNEYILYFSLGGVSSKGVLKKLGNRHKQMIEKCWRCNGLKPIPFLIYLRPIWIVRVILLHFFSSIKLLKKSNRDNNE